MRLSAIRYALDFWHKQEYKPPLFIPLRLNAALTVSVYPLRYGNGAFRFNVRDTRGIKHGLL
nr:MAG TPA: hypothetical protein [Caudoviricetes sp.]